MSVARRTRARLALALAPVAAEDGERPGLRAGQREQVRLPDSRAVAAAREHTRHSSRSSKAHGQARNSLLACASTRVLAPYRMAALHRRCDAAATSLHRHCPASSLPALGPDRPSPSLLIGVGMAAVRHTSRRLPSIPRIPTLWRQSAQHQTGQSQAALQSQLSATSSCQQLGRRRELKTQMAGATSRGKVSFHVLARPAP